MSTTTPQEHQARAPPQVRNVADFLRSSGSGIKIRVGSLNGNRLDYFKGKSAVKALLSPTYLKLENVPPVTTEVEAEAVLKSLIPYAFYLRVVRGNPTGPFHSSARYIAPTLQQTFAQDDYYAWFYEGSQWTTYAGGVLVAAVMFALVMFPLWPRFMHLAVWYLSVGILVLMGAFFVLANVRLIFYIITVVVAPPGIWIFPMMFADVSVLESFNPLWEWDLPKKKKRSKTPGQKIPEEQVADNDGAQVEADSSRSGSRM